MEKIAKALDKVNIVGIKILENEELLALDQVAVLIVTEILQW